MSFSSFTENTVNSTEWVFNVNKPEIINNQNVLSHFTKDALVVSCQQTKSTPGVLLKRIPVSPHKTYEMTVYGCSDSPNAFLIAYYRQHRLSKNYTFLPVRKNNEQRYESRTISFYSGDLTTIHIGVCFTEPEMGDTMYIKRINLIEKANTTPTSTPPLQEQIAYNAHTTVSSHKNQTQNTQPNFESNQNEMFSWNANQYQSLICKQMFTSFIMDVAQVDVQTSNGTPAVFLKVYIQSHKFIKVVCDGYTSYDSDFRLCVYCPTTSKDLSPYDVFLKQVKSRHEMDVIIPDMCEYVLVGVTCVNPVKGKTAFLNSLKVVHINEIEQVDTVPQKIYTEGSVKRTQTTDAILESPDILESPGTQETSTNKNQTPLRNIRPRQIPEEIKNIELQIFNLIESINDMNVNLTKTEKKLIEKIRRNTS